MAKQTEAPARLYQQVADKVLAIIREQGLQPGARLPGENELATRLGISRPTVREALIALEITGHIEVRSGSGSYVSEHRPAPAVAVDAGPGPFELLHARLLLEGEIAAESAVRASRQEIEAMRAAINAMDEAMYKGKHSRLADRDFHIAVAAGTHNEVLVKLVHDLWTGIFSPLFHTMSERSGLADSQQMARRGHLAVLKAITARDPGAARDAMRHHLREVEAVLFRDPASREAKAKKAVAGKRNA